MLASSCVTITTVVWWSLRSCRISASSRAEVGGSSPADGSSRYSSGGSNASARAIAARLRMPPLKSAGAASKLSSKPTSASLARASDMHSAAVRWLNSCSGNITLSPTDIELHNAPAWNITPKLRRRLASCSGLLWYRSAWPYSTWPAAGTCRPIMLRSSVLLPQPLPPMITSTSPGRTSKPRSCCTTLSPNAIVNPLTWTSAWACGAGAGVSFCVCMPGVSICVCMPAHQPRRCRAMVSTDAATTIQTMACTTAAVVAWPTAWALRPAARPWRQPASATSMA